MSRPRQTHCKRGHEFTKANSRIRRSGGHDCRICANANAKIRYNANPALRARLHANDVRNKMKHSKSHRVLPASVWHGRVTACGIKLPEGSRIRISETGQPFTCMKCRERLVARLKNSNAPILNNFLPLHD